MFNMISPYFELKIITNKKNRLHTLAPRTLANFNICPNFFDLDVVLADEASI